MMTCCLPGPPSSDDMDDARDRCLAALLPLRVGVRRDDRGDGWSMDDAIVDKSSVSCTGVRFFADDPEPDGVRPWPPRAGDGDRNDAFDDNEPERDRRPAILPMHPYSIHHDYRSMICMVVACIMYVPDRDRDWVDNWCDLYKYALPAIAASAMAPPAIIHGARPLPLVAPVDDDDEVVDRPFGAAIDAMHTNQWPNACMYAYMSEKWCGQIWNTTQDIWYKRAYMKCERDAKHEEHTNASNAYHGNNLYGIAYTIHDINNICDVVTGITASCMISNMGNGVNGCECYSWLRSFSCDCCKIITP